MRYTNRHFTYLLLTFNGHYPGQLGFYWS